MVGGWGGGIEGEGNGYGVVLDSNGWQGLHFLTGWLACENVDGSFV